VAVETEVSGSHLSIGAGLAQRLAGVLAFGQRQAVQFALEEIGKAGQHGGSVSRRCRSPLPGRRSRSVDSAVDFVDAATCDRPDGPSGRRVDIVVDVAGGHRLSADE